jgi:hypothetical protein
MSHFNNQQQAPAGQYSFLFFYGLNDIFGLYNCKFFVLIYVFFLQISS